MAHDYPTLPPSEWDLLENSPTFARKKLEEKGVKYDSDKEFMGCIPPYAELLVAKALTFGAKKYDRENWRKVDRLHERYVDAAMRHINAHRRGEDNDQESGLDHLAHAVCCLMFILEYQSELEYGIET